VFSLAAGTPCVCAAYDRKVSAFAAENGLVSFRTDEDGLAEKLAAAVLRAAAGERLPPPDPELLRLAREPVAEAERLFGCR
jgi:polysaccharide pyruvyl transferase WcaK-like protein